LTTSQIAQALILGFFQNRLISIFFGFIIFITLLLFDLLRDVFHYSAVPKINVLLG